MTLTELLELLVVGWSTLLGQWMRSGEGVCSQWFAGEGYRLLSLLVNLTLLMFPVFGPCMPGADP